MKIAVNHRFLFVNTVKNSLLHKSTNPNFFMRFLKNSGVFLKNSKKIHLFGEIVY